MVSYIVHRLFQTIFVIFIVTILTFALLHIIPGDPVYRMLGTDATEADAEQLRHELGLDKPIFVQYGNWMWGVLHGEFGKSIQYHEDVATLISERLPVSAYIGFFALILGTLLGITGGITCAVRRGGVLDSVITLFANTAVAIPSFFLAIVAIYIFGLKLGWLPIQGWTSPLDDFVKSSRQLIMPVIALSIPNTAVLIRQTRSSMLETIRQDYIRTAYSKGLHQRIVIYKHALRNALTAIATIVGMTFANLIAGQVLIETVFNIPGMGSLLVRAAMDKDYLIIQGGALLVGIIVCMTNLVVDIVYGWIDPRIRYR